MNIIKQHGNQHLIFHAVLTFILILFSTALHAAEMSGNHTRTYRFEIRIASLEPVQGWESVPGNIPATGGQTIWISPEAALTNADVAQAWPDRIGNDMLCVGIMLTEEGALKLARLTKSHIGGVVAMMIDGRVTAAPRIMDEITGGRAMVPGNFSEEEASAIAKGIPAR